MYDVSRNQEQLILNVSRIDDARFDLHNLSSDTLYSLVVYSTNMKGKSGRTTLKSSTLSAPIVDNGQITALGKSNLMLTFFVSLFLLAFSLSLPVSET